MLNRSVPVQWSFGRIRRRTATVVAADPTRSAAKAEAKEGVKRSLGAIWYVIPAVWLVVAIGGYVVLVNWPALLAEPAPSFTAAACPAAESSIGPQANRCIAPKPGMAALP
ncbi:MAG: hypothetical protein ABIU58_04175 [Ramlibacter sp.]